MSTTHKHQTHTKKWRSRMSASTFKFFMNLWPPFVGAGIKVTSISKDFRKIEVHMKQRWYNMGYVGTHFGGSMYSMTDPFYMLILLRNLGHDYIVWDKAATINFIKPGRGKLKAIFIFTEEEITDIKQKAASGNKYVFDKPVDILNEDNEIVATAIKTLYVRKKMPTHKS